VHDEDEKAKSERQSFMPLPPRDPSLDTANNHYWAYHGLDTLLACKAPVTASEDEDGFIAVHQICELAFHQMLLDLPRALRALAVAFPGPALPRTDSAALADALYFLRRVNRFWRTVNATLPILGDLRAFIEFREALGPTSGFQSAQFRRIEILSGVPAYWHGGTVDASGQPHSAETAFTARYGAELAALEAAHQAHNLVVYAKRLRLAWDGIACAPESPFYALAQALLRYERAQLRFHQAHLAVAKTQLARVGVQTGTGGSSFAAYLQRYEDRHGTLFPGLSEVAGPLNA
jgi:tryptophan 2,3-dioxygenase